MITDTHKHKIAAGILCVMGIIAALYLYTYLPHVLNKIQLKNSEVRVEAQTLIDRFKSKSQPAIHPEGKYVGVLLADGIPFSITYDFVNGGTLKKEIYSWEINSWKLPLFNLNLLAGSARYSFEGSTLAFTDVVGDPGVFSEIGETLTVHSIDRIEVNGPLGAVEMISSLLANQQNQGEPQAVVVEVEKNMLMDGVFYVLFWIAIFVMVAILLGLLCHARSLL